MLEVATDAGACAPGGLRAKLPRMASAVTIRPFVRSDLDPARWLIYRAYVQAIVQLYGKDSATGYEVRSASFMALYIRRDPQGCFVAVAPDETIVGAVFCFVWGEVGWFGSLAVAPEWQGRGVGQALTGQAVHYLEGRGCRRVGLETWPHSPLVRHLYGKFGFQPVRPTIKFSRSVRRVASDGQGEAGDVSWITAGGGGSGGSGSSAPAAAATGAVHDVTVAQRGASPGEPVVDYRAEVGVPLEAGWADLAIAHDAGGQTEGYALCYRKRPGGGPVAALDARLLGVRPGGDAGATLDRLLAACDARARIAGVPSVTVDVNLRYAYAAGLLRARNFRPVYELLRMERELPGFDPLARSRVVDCSRWAG